MHAFGAVTKFGATDLFFATGTSGLKLGYKSPTTDAPASGVIAPEFRDILGGTGKHAHAGRLGMLGQLNEIFDGVGVDNWAFQCDGARRAGAAVTAVTSLIRGN